MSDPVKPVAELHDAYVWDCSECGAENWERSVVVAPDAMDDETREFLTESLGPWLPGDVTTHPESVTCRHCGAEYDAEDADAGDFEDDDES